MAVDPVPYVVHGAKHSADVFRQAFHDSTSGGEGISTPTSFHTRQTATPSNQVRVRPGGAVILNSYTGGAGQSYAVRNASETTVSVPASDSTGSKSWYIIVRVSDPQFAGQAPSDPEEGPYTFIECVSQSETISDPHLKLASVVVPASTATITNSMITSLREIANPLKDYGVFARPRIAEDGGAQIKLTARRVQNGLASWGEYFPGGAGIPNQAQFFLPSWATHMVIDARWMGIKAASNQNSFGRYWVEFGDEYRAHTWPDGKQFEFKTQHFGFNTTGTSGAYRTEWSLVDAVPIPAKLRGKTVTFVFKAGLDANASTSGITMDGLGGLSMRVDYVQKPENPDTI